MLREETSWFSFTEKTLACILLLLLVEDIWKEMFALLFEFMHFLKLGGWSTSMLIHFLNPIDWAYAKNQVSNSALMQRTSILWRNVSDYCLNSSKGEIKIKQYLQSNCSKRSHFLVKPSDLFVISVESFADSVGINETLSKWKTLKNLQSLNLCRIFHKTIRYAQNAINSVITQRLICSMNISLWMFKHFSVTEL